MNTIDIETLPEAVASKRITKKQGADFIWEDIYTNPQHYGILSMSEDQKSDFLLEIHENFEKLFDKFHCGQIPFRAFIAGCVSQYKMTFLRRQNEKKTEQKCITNFFKTMIEEESEKYEIAVADEPARFSPHCTKTRTFSDIATQETGTQVRRNRRIAELTAIILAMKACNEIDDTIIEHVCKFTGINRDLFHKAIQELKTDSMKKNNHHKLVLKRRNNAYFFHRKYLHEMLLSNPSESRLADLRRRYDSQTKRWEQRNKELSCLASTPSNKDIAQIIGLNTRTVSFYINHAHNKKASRNIRDFYQKDDSEKPVRTQDKKDKKHEKKSAGIYRLMDKDSV